MDVPDPPCGGSPYAAIGAFQAGTYHRNAFAQGTEQETAVLIDVLGLPPPARVIDVGCGNGRHVRALRTGGYDAVGVDLSPEVLVPDVPVVAALAQQLPLGDGSVDGLISVCQGGFGIDPAEDDRAVGEWSRVLRTGGRGAITAFSLVYAVRYMTPKDSIDVGRALHHHVAEVRGPDGEQRNFDLWTALYSVPHLCQLLAHHGLHVLGTAGVEPGAYQSARRPSTTDPELLVWFERG